MQKTEGLVWLCVLLFAITVFVFSPALKCDFQFYDENGYLVENPHVNEGLSISGIAWAFTNLDNSNWVPLVWLSHMIDIDLYGWQAWGHHLTNILFHAANVVLLFVVLNRLTGRQWRSLFAAALFAVHPLRVESVVWISERKDVLSTFFGLLAIWTYVEFAKSGAKKFYCLTLIFFACSLMSKAMLVTFPFVLLLLDYWPLQRSKKKSALLIEKIPLFLMIIPASVVAYFAQKSSNELVLHPTWTMRSQTVIISYARYLEKMFWPTDLAVLYPYPNSWPLGVLILSIALLVVFSILFFYLRKERPYMIIGWLWFLGTLVPVIGLVPLGEQSLANHYTYFPMIGILIIFVWGIAELSKSWRREISVALAAVTLTMLALRTRAEIFYWKDTQTLWSRAIAVTKDNYFAMNGLGKFLLKSDTKAALSNLENCGSNQT